MARALKFQSNIPLKFWGHCILTAVYLINRTPSSVLSNKTPFEVLFGFKPTYDHLRVFGCLCYASTLSNHKSKFDPRARKCIFLGYPFGVKGYNVLDLTTNTVFTSRDVIFHENVFPFSALASDFIDPFILGVDTTTEGDLGTFVTPVSIPDVPLDSSKSFPVSAHPSVIEPISDSSPHDVLSNDSISLSESVPIVVTNPLADPPPIRKSARVHKTPVYLQDYACTAALASPSTVATSHPSGSPYDISACLTYSHLVPAYKSYLMNVNGGPLTPQYFSQAVLDPLWREAMDKEIQALEATKTWVLTPLPLGKKPIGCKWVYRIKLCDDGSVDRYKARLVAKGYTQREGLDFLETFSPVAKTVSVRVLIALASAKGWPLHQLDINNAFLHGDLNEEVYMALPPSYHSKGVSSSNSVSVTTSPMVCKLVKSLYGLKQASRQWNAKLSATILALGFVQSQADHSLFVHSNGSQFTALLIYVDDMVITGNDSACVDRLKKLLDQKFGIKGLGSLKYFLGLEIARSPKGISIN